MGLSESRPKLENPGVAAVHEFRHTHSRSPPELNPQIHLQRYAVGKIYPDYVDFRDYDLGDEDFLGPNYLASQVGDPMVRTLSTSARNRALAY